MENMNESCIQDAPLPYSEDLARIEKALDTINQKTESLQGEVPVPSDCKASSSRLHRKISSIADRAELIADSIII